MIALADLPRYVRPNEKPTTAEVQFLEELRIIPHPQRYRTLKLVRYILTGNHGPGVTPHRRTEILHWAQEYWIGRRAWLNDEPVTVEFLMPYQRALGHQISINPAARSFEAWVRWENTGQRANTGCPLFRLVIKNS